MTKDIILDKDGPNEMLLYATKIEELTNKQLTVIALPSTNQERSSGPKKPIIVDLLRVTKRFNVDGAVSATHVGTFKNITEKGGVFVMDYAGTEYNVNVEKYSITEIPEDAQGTDASLGGSAVPDYFTIKLSVVEGEDYGS